MANVRKLDPRIPVIPKREKVAAYARVSLGKDSMMHSLAAQISYYSEMIQRNPLWSYAGVYADGAYTGTKAERPEFQRMLSDCRAGKIDRIITKSISRFARNTVTLLSAVRELKSMDIDVYFEKERIHSSSGEGELMLTILTAFAQEESRSVSDNMKWSIQKQFKEGRPANWRFMYGYRIRKGHIEVFEPEAMIVRKVFTDYIAGIPVAEIARRMRAENIPTIRGGEWTAKAVATMLGNEKYAGNALLQKTYIGDHLQKKKHINLGELPMYSSEGCHPALIDKATWNAACALRNNNRVCNGTTDEHRNKSIFTGMIHCARCGKNFQRKSNAGRHVWNCATYLRLGKDHCPAKQLPEDILISELTHVLKIPVFDENVFQRDVRDIIVTGDREIRIVFTDGNEVTRPWRDRSRADAWTPEMRNKAAENARRKSNNE